MSLQLMRTAESNHCPAQLLNYALEYAEKGKSLHVLLSFVLHAKDTQGVAIDGRKLVTAHLALSHLSDDMK